MARNLYFAVEQTAITQWPFVTNFNVGNGYSYYLNGTPISTTEWNNRSLQDIMPTYRWIIEQELVVSCQEVLIIRLLTMAEVQLH